MLRHWFPRLVPAFAAILLIPGVAALHLHLVRSTPKEAEIVTSPPKEIRLWFSQKPEAALTSIGLLREDSSSVTVGKVVATDDSLSVKVPLTAPITPGAYTVTWRTLSKDGHAVRGRYQFQVVPPPAGAHATRPAH
jgi:methionine-rich copper-binding protein CopC